ncbi:flavin reductase family protein [Hwanghaeella sp.]|uniref:flavin reductase family protein n=1 Tax=Hwanghaeella sp. TaxID=2605943 RepID=UPI003CCBB617
MTFDPRTFRDACGHFATGVVVATCLDAQGAPAGVTVNSFTSVSLDPPLVLFCLDKGAYSRKVFANVERFAINMLSGGQQGLSTTFAQSRSDRFEGVSYTAGQAGVPLLDGALCQLECIVEHRYPGGDHEIIVGRVTDLSVDHPEERPLIYYKGRYDALAKRNG